MVDVVAVLTESNDPKQYIKKIRSRDEQLNLKWGTICTPVKMIAADGKKRSIQASNMQAIQVRKELTDAWEDHGIKICFYILGFAFSLIYYFYNLTIYYIIISESITQLINHNSHYLDDLTLLVVLGVSFILWFVGLYGRLKDRKKNKERNM